MERDLKTSTVDGAAAYDMSLRYTDAECCESDAADERHDGDCICQCCSDKITMATGAEFIWKIDDSYSTEYRFSIEKFINDLLNGGSYEMNTGTTNIAQYRNPDTKHIVTIKRIQMADIK